MLRRFKKDDADRDKERIDAGEVQQIKSLPQPPPKDFTPLPMPSNMREKVDEAHRRMEEHQHNPTSHPNQNS
jgi:hypothetical protein